MKVTIKDAEEAIKYVGFSMPEIRAFVAGKKSRVIKTYEIQPLRSESCLRLTA